MTVSLEKDDAVVSHFVVSDAHGRAVARFEDGADPIEMIFAFPPTEPNRSLLFVRRNGNHTFGNVYLVSPKGIRSVWDTSTSWTIEPRQLGGRWRIVVQRYSFQLGGERLEKQWGPSALEVYDVLRSSVSENSHAWRIARRHLSRK